MAGHQIANCQIVNCRFKTLLFEEWSTSAHAWNRALSGLSAEYIVRRSCCLKCHRKDTMTSKELKLHRNEHAVRGRPTRKEVEHIRNGSVRMPYERSIYERTF